MYIVEISTDVSQKLLDKIKVPIDPKVKAQQEADFNQRVRAQYERSEARMAELVL